MGSLESGVRLLFTDGTIINNSDDDGKIYQPKVWEDDGEDEDGEGQDRKKASLWQHCSTASGTLSPSVLTKWLVTMNWST